MAKPLTISLSFLLVFLLFNLADYAQTGGFPTGSDTSCNNGNSFYQKTYGRNKDEILYAVAIAPDSGQVVAGKTNSSGAGGYDGFIIRMNKSGSVVWSKVFGGANDDDFTSIERTSDNGYIACGTTKSHGNPAGEMWAVKVDASGNTQWAKKYGDGSPEGDVGRRVIQLSDGGYALCAIYKWAGGGGGIAQSFVVRTDGQGNVIWSKQYSVSGASDDTGGLLEDSSSLVVVGYYNGGSTFMDGYIMKLDKSNGAVQWIRRYDAENRSTWFGHVVKTNTGYQVAGSITDNFSSQNEQVGIWNFNTDGTLQSVRKVVIPGIQEISGGWLALPDGGFVIADGENNSGADVLLTRVSSAGIILWSKKFLRAGRQQVNSIRASNEGGFVLGGNNNNAGTAADSSNIYIMKVDGEGTAGTCSGINTNDVTIVTPSYVTSTISAPQSNVTISNPVITVSTANSVLVTTTFCAYCKSQGSGVSTGTGSDTTCTNGITFYQKLYGGTKDDFGHGIVATPDSGFVITGQTNSFGSGGVDGYVMKVNKRGNVVWSKTVGGSNFDVLYHVKQTSDNGFITVGQTKSFGNTAGDAWMIKLDASGNVQWSRKYGDGNINGEIALDVVQLSDGGYAFVGSHRYAPGSSEGFVVRTDGQGNVVWAKQYGMFGSDQLAGIVEDSSSLVVAGFYQGGSFYDGYVMKLNKSNGAIQWIRGFDGEGRSTWFSRIVKTNNGYQVFALITDDYTDAQQQESVWNIDVNGNLQSVRKLVIPGVKTRSYGWYPLADGGFIAANGDNSNASDIILCRVNAGGGLDWSKKFARNGFQLIYNITSSPEGGYAALGYNNNAGITVDSNNVYLFRVDSLGNSGTCSGLNTTDLSVVTPSTSTQTTPITDLGTVTINNPAITLNGVNFTSITNTLCTYCSLNLPPIPIDTTCTVGIALYHKVYGGTKDDFGHGIVATPDSGFVITGQTNSFGSGGVDGYVMKVNKRGNVVWSKTVGGSNFDVLYHVKQTSDNGFITVGQTKSFGNTAGDAWMIKLDASGNVQWSRKYGDGNINGEIALDVVQLSDGGYAFVGSHRYAPGSSEGFVVRTDGQGNVVWAKQYGMSGSDQLAGIVEDSSSLVVAGFYQGGSFYDGYVMKLNKSNGAIQWIRGFDGEGRSSWFSRIVKTNNGYQVFALITDDYTDAQQQESVWNIDVNGNLQSVRKLVIPGVKTRSYGWYPLADGGFIAANGDNSNASDIILCRVNAGGGLDWSKKFARNGFQLIYNITSSPEGGYAALGYNNNAGITVDSNNVYLFRVDSLGNSGTCSGLNTTDLSVVTPSTSTQTTPITDLGTVTINNPVITVNPVNFVPASNTLCFFCKRKPTGAQRIVPDNITHHDLKVYPNPTSGDPINISIDARYDDEATISVVDVYGNILSTLSPRLIRTGQNLIQLNITNKLRNYSNYFIVVKYKNYDDAIKIFVVK